MSASNTVPRCGAAWFKHRRTRDEGKWRDSLAMMESVTRTRPILQFKPNNEYPRGEQKGIALDWASPWRVHMLQAIPGFVNLHVASQNDHASYTTTAVNHLKRARL